MPRLEVSAYYYHELYFFSLSLFFLSFSFFSLFLSLSLSFHGMRRRISNIGTINQPVDSSSDSTGIACCKSAIAHLRLRFFLSNRIRPTTRRRKRKEEEEEEEEEDDDEEGREMADKEERKSE